MGSEAKQLVCDLRRDNPCLTLESIANKVGVSRERVRQILRSESLPTKAIKRLWRKKAICPNCGILFMHKNSNNDYCSLSCKKEHHRITLSCDGCRRLFIRPQAEILYRARVSPDKKWFCSRACRSRYLGTTYGFGVHPSEKLTHCKRDHLFDETNSYYLPDGHRRCRTCQRQRQREYDRKHYRRRLVSHFVW